MECDMLQEMFYPNLEICIVRRNLTMGKFGDGFVWTYDDIFYSRTLIECVQQQVTWV